jgi:DNA mismatch repair ATPase MutL
VPATLHDADPVACLKRFLEQKESGRMTTDLEKHPEEIAALIACKRRSVKAGDSLTPEAMQSLLERLARCENPFNCPHGRPAFFQMTLDDLEKQFKRKV